MICLLRSLLPSFLLLLALSANAAVLPGFSVTPLGPTAGFLTSLVADSRGTIAYTTLDGGIYRFQLGADGKYQSVLLARVDTVAIGNSGLLGMALRDDQTAAVHYTAPNRGANREILPTLADVVSSIDLRTGRETVLHTFPGNNDQPAASTYDEHHGGNPTVAPDGSIFVAIGDYGVSDLAAQPRWNAGRVFQVFPDGTAREYAKGFRNPFDLAWDSLHKALIVPDNGNSRATTVPPETPDDEINVIHFGDDAGWPYTSGHGAPVAGATPPVYVFPNTIAPTGMVALDGRNPILQHGILLCGFVTKAIYYVPDISVRPMPPPIALVKGETSILIDVTEGGTGEIFFATPMMIYRLNVPERGDCNGDGLVNMGDVAAVMAQLGAGSHEISDVLKTAPPGTFGCDVNGDGIIDGTDVAALMNQLHLRTRAAQRR